MTKPGNPSSSELFWHLNPPANEKETALVVCIPDWIYGLLPYCGPGTRYDAWIREKSFQDEICRFLNNAGIATLFVDMKNYEHYPPYDLELIEIAQEKRLTGILHRIISETGYTFSRTILFAHGFGIHLLCLMAASGIRFGGYIIAAGVYSDTEMILEYKYHPIRDIHSKILLFNTNILDPETDLLMKHFGTILSATRKGKKKIYLTHGNVNLDLYLHKELFSQKNTTLSLVSPIDTPSLVIHGSGDLDIPVCNAFSLEQKIKQHNPSVSRIILIDCDHWFRKMPKGRKDQLVERLNGNCLYHPMENRFFSGILMFIRDVVPEKKNEGCVPVHVTDQNEKIALL